MIKRRWFIVAVAAGGSVVVGWFLFGLGLPHAEELKQPGGLVFVLHDTLRYYRNGQQGTLACAQGSLPSADVFLGYSEPLRGVVFLKQRARPGIITLDRAHEQPIVRSIDSLQCSIGGTRDWSLAGDMLLKIVGRNRRATLVSVDFHGRVRRTALPVLPQNIGKTRATWESAPSVQNGTKVVFSVPLEQRPWRMVVMDTAARTMQILGHGRAPQWSPDGTRIAFVHSFTLRVGIIEIQSGRVADLTITQPSTLRRLMRIGAPLYVHRIAWVGSNAIACSVARLGAWEHKIYMLDVVSKRSYELPVFVDPAKWAWIP